MSPSVLHMSMSLDGYIAGPNDEPGNPGGDGFDRPSGPAGELVDEWNTTGAVLAGRRTVEQVDHWGVPSPPLRRTKFQVTWARRAEGRFDRARS